MSKKNVIFATFVKFMKSCKELLGIRLFYTLKNGYRLRKQLKRCLTNTLITAMDPSESEFGIDQIISLNLNDLKHRGFQALILDYDGVLSAYKEIVPPPNVLAWLEQAVTIFGAHKIFILSNNPLLARQQFFANFFQGAIVFVKHRLKPYPDGIYYIIDYLVNILASKDLHGSSVLMIDDRLLTGVLAAKIAGIASCLILTPYTNFRKRFIIEWFFVLIRKLERLLIWHL